MREVLAAVPDDALKVFDVNLRQDAYSKEVIEASLRIANVFKLADDELDVVASMLEVTGDQRQRIEQFAARFDLRAVALTRGADGALMWADGEFCDHGGHPAEVRDTVGAGDSFTATMTMGLLKGLPPDRVVDHAACVGAWVCSQDGAVPELPDELTRIFTA